MGTQQLAQHLHQDTFEIPTLAAAASDLDPQLEIRPLDCRVHDSADCAFAGDDEEFIGRNA